MSLNNLNSRFRLSTNDILSTPTPKPSHFLSSTPVLTPYNFIMMPYALNGPSRVSQEQMGTPCPQNRKWKKENQSLSDIPPSLTNSEELKHKKRAYGPRWSTADKLEEKTNSGTWIQVKLRWVFKRVLDLHSGLTLVTESVVVRKEVLRSHTQLLRRLWSVSLQNWYKKSRPKEAVPRLTTIP